MISLVGLFIVTSPVILAGVFNMIFVKSPLLKSFSHPIDGGTILWDGKRMFGNNKTWRGFAGMVFFSALFGFLLEVLCKYNVALKQLVPIDYSQTSGALMGAALGVGYMISELPNSFLKRRLDIPSGKNVAGAKGLLFTVVDQSDSVVGCILVFLFFCPLNAFEIVTLIIAYSLIHYLVNLGLYLAKLKQQAG